MRKILFTVLALAATPAFAQDGEDSTEIGGLRIEGHVGIERPNLNDDQNGTTYVAKLGSSIAYGGELGYDIPVSETVTVGPYVSFDFGSSDTCETYTPAAGQTGNVCFKSKSDLSVGGRVALRAGSKGELYLGVGYDSYASDFTIREFVTATNATTFSYTNTDNRGGIGVSFGGNYDVSKNFYVGLGMRVSELGEFEGSGYNLQRFQGHLTLGIRM